MSANPFHQRCPGGTAARAFSLVEVCLAMGIATFSLLAILALLQTGLSTQKATVEQTVAAGILSTVYADLVSTPGTEAASFAFQIPLLGTDMTTPQTIYFSEAATPTGSVGAPPTEESRYRATIGIQPQAAGSKDAARVRILVTWPAARDPRPAEWPARVTGAVEVVTALQRN
ncbi:hypothetical protein DB346_07265 [Verrucomicrobia bacterium LW23]|nr:hypothetical protein DB346_07265 [Verrucomicrobia bacterium LW23]